MKKYLKNQTVGDLTELVINPLTTSALPLRSKIVWHYRVNNLVK